MNLEQIVIRARRLNWALEFLALCSVGWLSAMLYGQETEAIDANLTQQTRQALARAASPASLVSAELAVKPLLLNSPDESALWKGLQDWLHAEAPVQGRCAMRPMADPTSNWTLLCTGLTGKSSSNTLEKAPEWQALKVMSAITHASPKPDHANAKPKITPHAEGWFITDEGNTLHFDPQQNTWTSKPAR